MNLVSMAMKYVGPMVAQKIATKLGIGGPLANKLIAAALPMILGSVMGKSKSSTGLSSIMGLLTGDNKPDASSLTAMFESDGDVDGFANAGGGMLEGLLGGNDKNALSGALGQFAGVGSDTAGSLMNMLAPAALGTVGNVVSEQNLDANGLASFLEDQSGNVADSIPADLMSNLSGNALFEGIQSKVAAPAVKTSGSKLPLILGAVAVAALGWMFLGGDKTPELPAVSEISQDFMVGDVNIGEQFGNVTGSLTDAFGGITDIASAEAALPQLTDLSGQIGSIGEAAGGLTGAAQTGFQGIVGTALGQLRPIIEGAIEASGAGSILQPIADQILGALEGMAG